METPEDLRATCSSVLISLTLQRSIPMFRWSFLYFHLHPLPLVQSLDAAEKSLALSMPYRAVTHIGEITPEPSLLQARQPQISQPLLDCQMLQSHNHLCGPPLDSFLPMSVLNWAAQNWTQHLSCVSPGLSRGEESPPSTCWQCSS